MTKRDRIAAALARKPVDRPPVAFWRHAPEVDHTAAGLARAMLDFHRRWDLDLIKIMSSEVYCVEDWGCTGAARIMGRHDRGLVREGLAADLMIFDLSRIGVKEDAVWHDGPAGAPRRVQGADGVDYVIVGGEVVLDHGRHPGALPGRVLRSERR